MYFSVIGEGDSIVGVLGMKDKMQMHRELDSLDIVNTVNIDTGLEKERNDASMATTELLITGNSAILTLTCGTTGKNWKSFVIVNLRLLRVKTSQEWKMSLLI